MYALTIKKLAIKKIKKFVKGLDNSILQNKNLEFVKRNKIRKISYIDINTFWEDIFSIRNINGKKQLTILGIKFELKSKKLENREQLRRIEQKIDKLNKKLTKMDVFISTEGIL